MRLVSHCLVGENCTWKGGNNLSEKIYKEIPRGDLVPVCPEVLGGLPTPRLSAEIRGGTGLDVLEGRARVIESNGNDVTEQFVKGAQEVLKIAKSVRAGEAILKARSPSCGSDKIYDGTFSHTLIDGDGVAATLLRKNGIRVITDEQYQSHDR